MLNRAIRKYANITCLTIIAVISLAISHLAYSEEEKPVGPFAITYNGNTWNSYTDSEKISFLQGFYEGAFYGALNYKSDPEVDENQMFLTVLNTYAYPDGGDLKQLSAEIDGFYADDNNLTIPIHEALVFIEQEKTNKDMIDAKRVEWLKKAREKWAPAER